MTDDHASGGIATGLCLGQHACAFNGVESEIGAGLLFQLKTMSPSGEFVRPGFNRIDIVSGLIGHEGSAPAIIAVQGHRLATPFAVLLQPPNQRCRRYIMSIAIEIGPNLDALPYDSFHGKAAAIDQRINVFDMKSAACCGALDSLNCFVHGDAIEIVNTPHSMIRERDAPDPYRKPLAGHWFPGNAGEGKELDTAILFLHLWNFIY